MTTIQQLPLPIAPADALRHVVQPALALLPARMNTMSARVMMIAIALQESNLAHRAQIGGPARGLWQFERQGGVYGVLRHASTRGYAATVCSARGVRATEGDVYLQLEHDDVLAAAFARLLLWSDPAPLPPIDDAEAGWALYRRTWRPGKPHPNRWPRCHRLANGALT